MKKNIPFDSSHFCKCRVRGQSHLSSQLVARVRARKRDSYGRLNHDVQSVTPPSNDSLSPHLRTLTVNLEGAKLPGLIALATCEQNKIKRLLFEEVL